MAELNSYYPLKDLSTLKAYYRFESGALTTDSSGEGHTLTAISDPAEDASGKFGGAVSLDGNDAYSAVDHADFKPTGVFTIGFWVKSATNAADQYIFQSLSYIDDDFAGFCIRIDASSGKVSFISGKDSGNVFHTDYDKIVGGTNIFGTTWHFVVGVWDGSYLRLYVDGSSDAVAVAWANAPAYNATNYVRIGCYNGSGSNAEYLTGSLDDLFLFNGKALTATEVNDLYTGKITSPASFLMNLAGNWKNN